MMIERITIEQEHKVHPDHLDHLDQQAHREFKVLPVQQEDSQVHKVLQVQEEYKVLKVKED
jgi:stress response protein YsnF